MDSWLRQLLLALTAPVIFFFLYVAFAFPSHYAGLLTCLAVSLASYAADLLFTPSFSFAGRHVFITGGSDGLGLEVARLLLRADRGAATITLFARNKERLEERKRELEERVRMGEGGSSRPCRVQVVSGDAGKLEDVKKAIKEAEKDGGPVQVLIAAAGFADPKYFEDLETEDFLKAMQVNYLGVVHCAQAFLCGSSASNTRKFVAVSSVAASVPFIGYSAYAPSKAAVRAFCDCLRNEFADVPDTSIHVCFPPDMETPGFTRENEKKPLETKTVWPEAFNEVFKPEQVASHLLDNLARGRYHIQSPDLFGNLLVSFGWGHYPRNHVLLEAVLAPVFVFLHEIMTWKVDYCVASRGHHHAKRE